MQNKQESLRKMVLMAMLAAVAYLMVTFIRIPAVMFLKYEPKDVVITIGGFLMGPMASLIVSLLVSLLEMVSISQTGPGGCIMNFLSTCSFACVAALVYKKRHTLSGAVLGLLLGSCAMVIVMLLWNWLITPLYMGVDRQTVESMLIPTFLPFNLLKAGLNTALTLGLYKPLVTVLRKIGLVESAAGKASGSKAGIYALAGLLLVTCILLLLVFQGKL